MAWDNLQLAFRLDSAVRGCHRKHEVFAHCLLLDVLYKCFFQNVMRNNM